MFVRWIAPAAALTLLAPSAFAQPQDAITIQGGASFSAAANVTVIVQQPTVVFMQPPAPPPPSVVVVRPVAPPVAPPPPVVVVRPYIPPVPAPVVYAAPVAVPSGLNVSLQAPVPAEDDDIDLLFFGRYRNAFDTGEVGGVAIALRVLLNNKLSLETKVAYGNGGTEAGGNFDDVPIDLSLVWYPWERDFPIYFAFGGGFGWSSTWSEGDLYDPWGGSAGGSTDVWFVGTRVAMGLEFELWDFLLLTAESEFFLRTSTDEYGPQGGAGVSVDLGLGFRI
jgi:hypothetical protein